jgi:flagellar biosynthetic protein FlhB
MLLAMAPVAMAAVAMGFMMSSVQVGFVLSPQALAPNLAKLNPVAGLSRMVSARSLVELIKSIAKVAIVGYVGYRSVAGEYQNLFRMADMDAASMLAYVGGLTFSIGIKTGLILIVLGVADYLYQRFEYEKSIRMSKEELRQEAKEYDGDPLIRSRIRAKQREMSMARMMQAVPKADVVITNPTHYAVALEYDQDSMDAPTVVAKGKDLIALRIKEVAKEHGVHIVENKPLAQTLYSAVETGSQIPVELYKAVAEVLAYVYQMNRKR